MSTLKHGDLLAALVELPPMKVESFSVTLGVPKRIVDEARENHRGSVYRVKSEAMSWWIANAEIISWDAVATALESPGVDERNLAREIRSKYGGQSMPTAHHTDNHPAERSNSESEASPLEGEENICELAGIPHEHSSLQIPNPAIRFSELSIDDKEDLQAQIEDLKFKIHRKFLRFEAELVNSLHGRITAANLVRTLMKHCTVYPSESMYNVSLLQEHKQALLDAKDIEGVFAIMHPFYSYYNYELLQTIVDVHGSENDKEGMRQYILDFSNYCRRVPCVEFYDDHCQKSLKRVKLKFKLDYDKRLLNLADIKNIERQISKILNIRSSVLFLHSVEDGCTAITFLVPAPCIDTILKLLKEKATILQKEAKMMSIECDDKPIDEASETEIKQKSASVESGDTIEVDVRTMNDNPKLDDKCITLRAKASDTIISLKLKIQAQEDIRPDEQRLIFNGKVLGDYSTLSSCNIQDRATLYLGLKVKDITLFIKTLTGRTITVHTNTSATIGSIKTKVYEDMAEAIPKYQRFIYAGKELEDHITLQCYNITSDDPTIHLVLSHLAAMRTATSEKEPTQMKSALSLQDTHLAAAMRTATSEKEPTQMKSAPSLQDTHLAATMRTDTPEKEPTQMKSAPSLQDTHPAGVKFNVYIRMQTDGRKVTVQMKSSDSIQDVKNEIEFMEGISARLQELHFAGEKLEDQHTLSHYRVSAGSTLTLNVLPSRSCILL